MSVALLLLDQNGKDALTVSGSGLVAVTGTGIIAVNTGASEGANLSGSAVVSDAAGTQLTGTDRTSASPGFTGPVLQHQAAVADPLQLHLPPASAIPPVVSSSTKNISGGTVTLQAGTYVGGIKISGSSQVTLAPGVYYLKGGGLSVSGQSTVIGKGVVIINVPVAGGDVINISGSASVNLTTATNLTGALAAYNGVALMQDRASTAAIQISSALTITGTLYAPDAPITVSAGGLTVNTDLTNAIAGEVIAATLTVTGNGKVEVNT